MSITSTHNQLSFKEQKKKLNINGSMYLFNSSLTILELIDYLGFNKNVIVVDYNGVIIQQSFWDKTQSLASKKSSILFSLSNGQEMTSGCYMWC